MPLGPEEIYLYARHAGFSPDQAVTMTAVAMAESGGVLTAHNTSGEDSRGLWQVNLASHTKFEGMDASDPLVNARMAYEVSGGGADIGRWTVTHGDKDSPYLKFREEAEAASRAFGENGQGNWDPPANYYVDKVGAGASGGPPPPAELPTELPDDSNADFTPAFASPGEAATVGGAPPSARAAPQTTSTDDTGVDSDEDGLLDRYEKAAGTDAQGVDSDNDGFTDADELLEFGTDAADFGSNPLGATGGSAPTGTSMTAAPADAGVANVQAAGGGNKLDVFLDAAVAQDGDEYVFGAEVSTDAADSDVFDCSELVEWAGAQAGVTIPDGSFNQYLHTKQQGGELTVEEALETPGALLFNFSSTPVAGGGRPSTAHVAISLGDGRTIEARSSSHGVGIFDATDRGWTHAGAVAELGTELSGDFGPGVVTQPVEPAEAGTDSDEDGLIDSYERLIGADPFNADTDRDGFLDSDEIHAHRSDPLDFTDNALTPGGGGGYRPPLTTDGQSAAGQPTQPGQSTSTDDFDDTGQAPGSTRSTSPGQAEADEEQAEAPTDGADDNQGNGQGKAKGQDKDKDDDASDTSEDEETSEGGLLDPSDLEDHPEFLEAFEEQDLEYDLDDDGDVDADDFDLFEDG